MAGTSRYFRSDDESTDSIEEPDQSGRSGKRSILEAMLNSNETESRQSAKRSRVEERPVVTSNPEHGVWINVSPINSPVTPIPASPSTTALDFPTISRRISQSLENLAETSVLRIITETSQESNISEFHSWLLSTVILDDLSTRESLGNSNTNQLTSRELVVQAIQLYENVERLSPRELVNLPFIPSPMRSDTQLMEIPFLDPLLIVLWSVHVNEIPWMLNILPWRILDRPTRAGRSILEWILRLRNLHQWLETTRAPPNIALKIVRFVRNLPRS
ncbi:uncharacterized protein LOC130665670 [Microplitis mediator]|uniref:Uncharacterized protein n=1 Tax=Microplitis mediator bracovirus TaxID=1836595 RepID=A0A1D5API0_9VIRU|nr:uncharacterized protein LOC130665670 [Microplitis mediator]AOH69125.1 hypothetical protein A6F54_52 [Microplitis mediator bracovirus]